MKTLLQSVSFCAALLIAGSAAAQSKLTWYGHDAVHSIKSEATRSSA